MLYRVIVFGLVVALIVLAITQIIIPAFFGGAFFPLFRSRIIEAEKDFEESLVEQHAENIESQKKDLRK